MHGLKEDMKAADVSKRDAWGTRAEKPRGPSPTKEIRCAVKAMECHLSGVA